MRKSDKRVSTKGLSQSLGKGVPSTLRCLWRTHVQGCLRRDIPNLLTPQEYWEVSQRKCFFCGRVPFNTTKWAGAPVVEYNGVDRVDNTLAYQKDNVVACCKTCNGMKSSRPVEEFLSHCERVAAHQQSKRAAEERGSREEACLLAGS